MQIAAFPMATLISKLTYDWLLARFQIYYRVCFEKDEQVY